MTRAVDGAMAEDRPEKQLLRKLWLDVVEEIAEAGGHGTDPIYVTLCGAAGHEIDMLIERGLIQRTETGALAKGSEQYIAVESSPFAVLGLKKRFPGLKTLEDNVLSLAASDRLTSWPGNEARSWMRAKVINLDFNQSLKAEIKAGQLVLSDLEIINKIAVLRRTDSQSADWWLFVTYNAVLNWGRDVMSPVLAFLKENFSTSSAFEEHCERVLDGALMEIIRTEDADAACKMNCGGAQQLLMAFVPKKIAHMAHTQGWLVHTQRNLRYGGRQNRAAMVSWMFHFKWDIRASAAPMTVYREALATVMTGSGSIQPDGLLVEEAMN